MWILAISCREPSRARRRDHARPHRVSPFFLVPHLPIRYAPCSHFTSSTYSAPAKDFIKYLLNPDPAARPSAIEALKHPVSPSSCTISPTNLDLSGSHLPPPPAQTSTSGLVYARNSPRANAGAMQSTLSALPTASHPLPPPLPFLLKAARPAALSQPAQLLVPNLEDGPRLPKMAAQMTSLRSP
jgi:serine/threonine protein kinase